MRSSHALTSASCRSRVGMKRSTLRVLSLGDENGDMWSCLRVDRGGVDGVARSLEALFGDVAMVADNGQRCGQQEIACGVVVPPAETRRVGNHDNNVLAVGFVDGRAFVWVDCVVGACGLVGWFVGWLGWFGWVGSGC